LRFSLVASREYWKENKRGERELHEMVLLDRSEVAMMSYRCHLRWARRSNPLPDASAYWNHEKIVVVYKKW
jgi:hypothetical protein